MPMVTQTPISAKINTFLLEKLDQECFIADRKRNKIIHQALNLYLDFVDTARANKILQGIDKDNEKVSFFDRWASNIL